MADARTYALEPGWPLLRPTDEAPSIDDAQTAPTAEQLLPQILQLAPRGAAWGTDEAGSRDGVSPVMAQYWGAIAAWTADLNVRESEAAAQAFPSLADEDGLAAWERELGIAQPAATIAARLATVRIRAQGVASVAPADFILLARLGGAVVTVEEPGQFQIGSSLLGPSFDQGTPSDEALAEIDMIADANAWSVFHLKVEDPGVFEGVAELRRALAPFVPLHVRLVVIEARARLTLSGLPLTLLSKPLTLG
ncbi:DUF2313 domain-containing protein [Hansschlegelia zhihuaiae]|uniref:DUF2313 domain-containing protein n=1 Tax=Hansschlegelia zhihuaiae TaxID=405005 RepID=A0A4Q0M411_9HYPH|nr:DUF2313 domain-containing protein [Hansschlegelia zhihuaiae]RXF67678.1 DUF2313 domain-containing protein [Hansschlegelia zhihuaiae]